MMKSTVSKKSRLHKLELVKEQAKRNARKKLLAFTLYTMRNYEVNWHHEVYADRLDDFMSGNVPRLMIFMPPQTGKSELCSRRMIAKLIGDYPHLRIAVCAYNQQFASKFNRQIKRIISGKEFKELYPDIEFGKNKGDATNTTYEFDIIDKGEVSGSVVTVGVGGGLTGNPVDTLIIDDPYKDNVQAFSPVYRERVWEWWSTVVVKRLHNDSRVLITLTRWHPDDLAGKLLKEAKETGENWETVLFEAIKEKHDHPKDPRRIGEALWESRHSKEKLLKEKRSNPTVFAAMNQQQPIDEKTTKFIQNFSYAKHVKSDVLPIDPAESLTISFDFNRNPCSALLGQKLWGKGLFFYKGFQVNGGTRALLEEMAWVRDGYPILEITGDNSGHSEKSSAEFTDFQLIEGFFHRRVDDVTYKANRNHIFSRSICNYVLHNIPCFFSEEGCPTLITEIRNAEKDSKGGLRKDDVKHQNHILDAWRYMIHLWFEDIRAVDEFADFFR